jgi:lipopolysaccharide transport system ATP-binding protein
MTNPAIRVRGLGKKYRIGLKRQTHSLRDSLGTALERSQRAVARRLNPKLRSDDARDSLDSSVFWALQDVSFDVQHGEVLGLIGMNGAGKSTLLKMLARITRPTQGFFEVYGRLGALLEIGTGFHPDLTGRENIFLNGSILGMKRSEITAKFDDIVGFSEIEKFIDTQVKHYSSGMYVRLAFSVAVHLDTDILLLDEVLAVGDIGFQKKSMDKIQSLVKDGRTVVLVNHQTQAIVDLSNRAIMLHQGKILADGDPQAVVTQYETLMARGPSGS